MTTDDPYELARLRRKVGVRRTSLTSYLNEIRRLRQRELDEAEYIANLDPDPPGRLARRLFDRYDK